MLRLPFSLIQSSLYGLHICTAGCCLKVDSFDRNEKREPVRLGDPFVSVMRKFKSAGDRKEYKYENLHIGITLIPSISLGKERFRKRAEP